MTPRPDRTAIRGAILPKLPARTRRLLALAEVGRLVKRAGPLPANLRRMVLLAILSKQSSSLERAAADLRAHLAGRLPPTSERTP